jgi:uncharacterized membrane protein HdeD (DUF308 family)
MYGDLSVHWWAIAIRGLLGVVLGIVAFAFPGITLTVLVALFAAWLVVDGIFALLAGARSRSWLVVAEGVIGVLVGIVAVLFPAITAFALLLLAAGWAIVTGILEIVTAVGMRRVIQNEFWLGLAGVASIVFGILLVANPRAGLLVLTWLIGAYALVWGVIQLALAFRLRQFERGGRTSRLAG